MLVLELSYIRLRHREESTRIRSAIINMSVQSLSEMEGLSFIDFIFLPKERIPYRGL